MALFLAGLLVEQVASQLQCTRQGERFEVHLTLE